MSTRVCPHCGGALHERPLRVRWPIRLALFAATGLAVYAGPAAGMIGTLEGVAGGFRPALPAVAGSLVLAAAALAAGVARVRRPVCETCATGYPAWLLVPTRVAPTVVAPPEAIESGVTGRRGFLATAGAVGASTLAVGAAGAGGFMARQWPWKAVGSEIFFAKVERSAPQQLPEWKDSRVKHLRRLGRTGAMVSDISLGSGSITDVNVAVAAIERGVNYFDTAPDYAHTGSEQILGEAIRRTGGRERMFLASKFCTADGHLPPDTPVRDIIAAVEGSLRRLGTDWLDLIHIHSCDRVERLMAPTFHEAFDRLKEQGKARFLGVSTHTPRLQTVARAAIESGRFDVLMLAYHHGLFPEISQIIDEAHARDIGVVAMKTLKGAKHQNLAGFRDEQTSYSQAAFRWVLSNPAVSCLVVSFSAPEHVDEYLYASGTVLRPDDVAVLQRYDRLIAGDYCRPHCGACLGSCPEGRPIDVVLRYDMYFADYGRESLAREKYTRLTAAGLDASSCLACPAPCAGSCPFELPIRAKMVRAHERLVQEV